MTLPPLARVRSLASFLVVTVAALLTVATGAGVAGCGANFSDLFSSGSGGTGGNSSTGVGPSGTGGGSAMASSSGSGAGGVSSSSTSSGAATSSGSSSSGSSSSSTTSSGSSSSSTTRSSLGSGSNEDCLNGIDDDGNGLVDCADPACNAGFECVDPTPPSWNGHSRVKLGAFPEPAAPPCPKGLTATTLYANPAGPAACSACTCGGLQGAACQPDQITCYAGSTSCNGQGDDWTGALSDGNCDKPTNLLGFNNALSCQITGPAMVAAPGSCAPSPTDFTNKEKWGSQVDVCGSNAAGGGCAGNKVCVPRGSGDPGESLCVRRDGAHACPMGWATVVSAYKSATDTRACNACSCAPNALCGPATYTFYDPNMCSTPPNLGYDQPIAIDMNGGCTDVSKLLDSTTWAVNEAQLQPGGSCAPSGGDPTGELKPSGAVTFCCQ